MATAKSDNNTGVILVVLGLGCTVVCGGMMVLGLGALLFVGNSVEPAYPVAAPPAVVYTPPSSPTGPGPDGVAGRIAALPQTGGSGAWDSAVKPMMVSAYDLNGSGEIDKSPEVGSIPCETWRALDVGVKESYDYGLRTIYGFETDYSWVGSAIGINESVRVESDSKLAACLSGAAAVPVPAVGGVAGAVRAIPYEGGGSAWDDAVKVIMVAGFDANGTGQIDNLGELASVPCEVWKALDDGVHVKWDYGLRTIYGFDGVAYLGGEIGFSAEMRAPGERAIIACGIGE